MDLLKRLQRLFSKSNRNLIVELTRATLKASDHNSFLGVLWSLIGPAVTLAVLYFIFRDRIGAAIQDYPLYLLIGIVCVNYFLAATTYAMRVFSLNRDLVLNSTIPREDLMLSNLFINTYKFLIEVAICVGLCLYFGLCTMGALLWLIPLVAGYIGFVLGVGFIFALIYCFVSDVEHIWNLVSRLLFFITPVFFSINNISPLAKHVIYWANPLTPIVISFHEILLGGSFSLGNYMYSLAVSFGFLLLGYAVFLRGEQAAMERA